MKGLFSLLAMLIFLPVMEQLEDFDARVMNNGDMETILGIGIEAYPAYNIVHKRSSGVAYHPKGEGNAYLLTFGDTRVLIGGDTENVPELKMLKDIDVAFLSMNLPYTMSPEMVADLALAIQPSVLYPYHYGQTDPKELFELPDSSLTGVPARLSALLKMLNSAI